MALGNIVGLALNEEPRMRILTCTTPGELTYGEAAMPELKKDHAIIRIRRIGICGTDLHAFEGTQPYFSYPRVLGHELSGELVEADGAPGFVAGEAVTFIPYFHCGHCIACRSGKPNCCLNMAVCGVHVDGGMVEYLQVPSGALLHGGDCRTMPWLSWSRWPSGRMGCAGLG